MTKNIYLTGPMGAGKTTTAKLVGEILNKNVIDTDTLIEEMTSLSIEEIFKEKGEEDFREFEQKALEKTFNMENIIVSTGGGLICYKDNLDKIYNKGIICCLIAPIDILYKRITNDTKTRPLLKNNNNEENTLIHILYKRASFYIKSHIMIDTSKDTIDSVAKKIISFGEEYEKC